MSNNKTTAAIGRSLRDIRKLKGLSQKNVAILLGRNQAFVSRCESGFRRITVEELITFADIYNKSIDDFIDLPR